MKISGPILRIVDANFNRSREALRVCEDITRFIFDDQRFTRKLKIVRQKIGAILKDSPNFSKKLIDSRDSENDIGKGTSFLETKRRDIKDIFYANIERAKESLRVLEEILKLENSNMAECIKILRYEVYAIEKEVNAKF